MSTYSGRDYRALATRMVTPTALEAGHRWYSDKAWEMYRYLRVNRRGTSYVYFISEKDNDGSLIKIGTSKRPTDRITSIQGSNWRPLTIERIVAGDSDLECSLHAKFSLHRVTGEWFSAEAREDIFAVADHLAQLQRDGRWLESRFATAIEIESVTG